METFYMFSDRIIIFLFIDKFIKEKFKNEI